MNMYMFPDPVIMIPPRSLTTVSCFPSGVTMMEPVCIICFPSVVTRILELVSSFYLSLRIYRLLSYPLRSEFYYNHSHNNSSF